MNNKLNEVISASIEILFMNIGIIKNFEISNINCKKYQVCLAIIYKIFNVGRIPNIWCWSSNILRGCKVMCYQVCVVLVQECLRLKKRKFKHTVQWVSLKTFSLIFILLHSPFFLLFFSRLDAAYGNSLYMYSYSLL